MLKFLVNNVEQLDLALEHISQGDANNARFGLMLVDNVVEITLHQIAKDLKLQIEAQPWMYHDKPYEHVAAMWAALGQQFGPKVKFAKLIGYLRHEASETISICHSFRNEVYHIGVQHETILPAISRFHFKIACEFLGDYTPFFIGYSSDVKLPERVKKYFETNRSFVEGIEIYQAACASLGDEISIQATNFAATLADHLDMVVEDQDIAIGMIATGGPRITSRDEAVVESMAWKVAFTGEAKKFAQENGWSKGSVLEYVKWIEKNFPMPIRKDPISVWRKRALAVRREMNPHKALKKYRNFMTRTAETRATLDEAHAHVDQYIQEQIDFLRGK